MKKFLIILFLVSFAIGCSDDDYEQINIDTSNPSELPAYFLLTNASTSLFDQMVSTNVNLNVFKLFAQYYTETQYSDEANYDLTRRDIPGNHWGELYRDVLYDLKSAKESVEADETLLSGEKANQLAVIDILSVYTWQVLVDTFGNVPYTEALQGLDNQTPVYDDAETIYMDLLTRITNDINSIDVTSEGFGSNDLIYEGDMAAWKKLAASVKLRIAVQILDSNTSVANTAISEAVASGVIQSNADNFVLAYLSADPYKNPIAVDLNSRNDFVPANTIVDMMNALEDPRRPIYFQQNLGDGVYEGGIYGAGSSFADFTHLGELLYESETPGDLLDAAEVHFLMAEAKAKGASVPGTIEDHYNAGIQASMEYWGVASDDVTEYLNRPDVAFSTAAGSDLQKVANQFWLAMFNRGFEGWNIWRRTGSPALASPAPLSNLPIPLRYTYPAGERTINRTNYEAASNAIGGDEQQTRVFWDVN